MATWRNKFLEERDRRYSEVAEARAEALQIKGQADRDALALAQKNQDLKDDRTAKLSEDVVGSRGNYATKDDLSQLGNQFATALKPIQDYIAGASASERRGTSSRTLTIAVVTILVMLLGSAIAFASLLAVVLL